MLMARIEATYNSMNDPSPSPSAALPTVVEVMSPEAKLRSISRHDWPWSGLETYAADTSTGWL